MNNSPLQKSPTHASNPPDLTTSLISCTPRELSFTGTSVRVWRKVNFPKLAKIWPLWKKIMKRSESIPSKARAKKKAKNIKSIIKKLFERLYCLSLFYHSEKEFGKDYQW